jgi:hypothetical protein
VAYAKEDALELGLVDIEPGPESERLDVIEYLDLLVVSHDNLKRIWMALL